jgi:hypothetical protein
MQRLTFILAGTLGFQLILALGLSLGGSDYRAFEAKEPLMAFDPASISKIQIDQSGANSVTLVNSGGKWDLPEMADFPADQGKVREFLGALAGLKKGWVTATTSDTAKRFKVSDEEHERRIVLESAGKQVSEVLLGTSPSFKQVHARSGRDSNIYNVQFATYQADPRPEGWMDRNLLSLRDDLIASITVGDVTLERKDGRYVLAGLAEAEKPKENEVLKLASAVVHPTFDAVQGKGADALAKVNDPEIQVTVKRTDGSAITYKYKKEPAGGAYLFSRSDQDFLFRVAETSIEPLAKAKHETLVEAKKTEGTEAQSATKPQEAPTGSGG